MKKVLLTILGLTLTAFAFWPAGGVKVVETPDAIENPQMVYLNDGSVVISWEADRQIYCQKLDTTGVIHWDAAGVRVCLSDSNQRDHHMVTDGQDVWFVWQDERSDDGDIYAQKINGSTGQRLWGDAGKAVCLQSGEQALPLADMLVNNQLGVIWQDYGPLEPGLDYDARVQWMNSTGQPAWGVNGISVPRDLTRRGRQGCFRSGNNMLALFSGRRESDTTAMLAQRIDSTGNFLWDTLGVLIEYLSNNYGTCSDGLGGSIVLFHGWGYTAVQRIDSLGQIMWDSGGVQITEFALNTSGYLHSSPYPSPDWTGLISDDTGGCSVWNGFDVHHVDSIGNLSWGSNGVPYWENDGLTYRLAGTRLCSDGNRGLLVTFDNLEWDSPDWPPYVDQGIRVQRINAEGEIVFDINGLIVRLWEPEELPGEFLSDASAIPGGVILAWLDNRYDPNNSLYAQIVDTTGKIGSGIEEILSPIVNKPTLEVDWGIGSQKVSLKYALLGGETGTLKLFDASGRLHLKKEDLKMEGTVIWATSDIPRGVYFAQLATTNARISRKLLILR